MSKVESLGKQVSSLNARAAHTANSQLTLLQDENKRMVAERTVLQTQVCATIRILKKKKIIVL